MQNTPRESRVESGVTLSDFVEEAYQQGARLAPEITDPSAHQSPNHNHVNFEPTPMFAAIAQAGRALRKNPDARLTSQWLRPTRLIANDFTATTLADIVNASIQPVRPGSDTFSITCKNLKDIDACSYAEMGFATAVSGLKKPKKLHYFNGSQIIIDDNNKPLFLRKSDGQPSSLALQPFVVNGIPFPAGSITRVELDNDYFDEEDGSIDIWPSIGELEVIDSAVVTGVAFKRLSAYCLDAGTRGNFRAALDHHNFFVSRRKSAKRIIQWLPLDTISQLAESIVDNEE